MSDNESNDDNPQLELGAIHTQAFAFSFPFSFPPTSTSPTIHTIRTRERPFAADPAYGLHTWPSARKLARYLHKLACSSSSSMAMGGRRRRFFEGRSVIELGCG